MLKVGLTGGIGSGKSTIGHLFHLLGVPVYIADLQAHRLMISNPDVQGAIIALLGEQAFDQGLPDRKYIAGRVFHNNAILAQLNAIVHPAVRSDFTTWCTTQSVPYVIQEAAVLFESGGAGLMDELIMVWAPEAERIARVMRRDQVTDQDVRARMQHQWPDTDKVALAQFVVINDGAHSLIHQVSDLHSCLLRIASQGES